MARISTILLTHEPAPAVARMLDYWTSKDPDSEYTIAYGGPAEVFQSIDWPSKVLVDDPALRTSDHPRERQSYQGVLRAALPELEKQGCELVHLAEYDQVPVVSGLGAKLAALAEKEGADVLGHGALRVDGSSHPHWINHIADDWFGEYWRTLSRRENPNVILSMLGCGCLWTMDSFREVAELDPPGPIYLELFLPTAAHHLGFRVRSFGKQVEFMHPHREKRIDELDDCRGRGALSVHPVKGMWARETT